MNARVLLNRLFLGDALELRRRLHEEAMDDEGDYNEPTNNLKGTHIQFVQTSHTGRTGRYNVLAKDGGTLLGEVKWYGPWRCYCFFAGQGTLFEKTCLRDIAQFCDEQTREQKVAARARKA